MLYKLNKHNISVDQNMFLLHALKENFSSGSTPRNMTADRIKSLRHL